MTTSSTKAKASRSPMPSGVEVLGEITPAFSEILTPKALAFVAKLQRQFGTRRKQCLEHRQERQTRLHQREGLDFLPETKHIRDGDWKCAPIPSDIQDRRVEITGPTDRKMVINALNSGAKIFMADFEDANAPTWRNMVEGQINLRDAIRGTINFTNPEGKKYKLNEQVAVLMPRPRGWHLLEKHVLIDGEPVAGGLFDFGLFFYHNAQELIARGSGPYFYLPKMESHLEARIWNDVFQLAQEELGIPYGTIWCETSQPNLAEAKKFAEGIHARFPGKLLAYNCSPSFNWRKKLDSGSIAKFQRELGAMGYKFQFVTLAGFQALNYSMFQLARGYRDRGMEAYAELQEAEFAAEKHGYSATKHQQEVGTGYFDDVAQVIAAGLSSTTALRGSTEQEQF
jgi:hypothetical protein